MPPSTRRTSPLRLPTRPAARVGQSHGVKPISDAAEPKHAGAGERERRGNDQATIGIDVHGVHVPTHFLSLLSGPSLLSLFALFSRTRHFAWLWSVPRRPPSAPVRPPASPQPTTPVSTHGRRVPAARMPLVGRSSHAPALESSRPSPNPSRSEQWRTQMDADSVGGEPHGGHDTRSQPAVGCEARWHARAGGRLAPSASHPARRTHAWRMGRTRRTEGTTHVQIGEGTMRLSAGMC